MADKATAKQTGGGGFTFADKVAARFLVQMLLRDMSYGSDLGPVTSVDFETSESGNPLDDLQVAFQHGTQLYVSIKSNRQLTRAGFNREFVIDAWRQWSKTASGRPFDAESDLLGLTLGMSEDAVMDEWNALYGQLWRSTPERMVERLLTPGQTNPVQRAIFESLRETGGDEKRDMVETARLATRVRLISFTDRDKSDAVNLCAQIVAGGALAEGEKLWDALLVISSEGRSQGAHYDLPRLLKGLSSRFELRDYPDYTADWQKLDRLSKENLKNETRNTLGAGIHLPRNECRKGLVEALDSHAVTVIVGESGSGKSALLAEAVSSDDHFSRILWITAEQVAKPSQEEVSNSLGLRHTVPDLIVASTVENSVLVVDGFEQFEKAAQKSVVRWIRALKGESLEGWKVALTCQARSLDAVRDLLMDAGVSAFGKVELETPRLSEVLEATQEVPSLLPLLMRKELAPVLRNLLVLDWVIREEVAQRIPVAKPWIGETEIIDIIWAKWIGTDAKRHAREHLLRSLGREEGEKIFGSVPLDSFQDRLELVGELEERGLLRTDKGTLRFFHDLMGDWARYRGLTFANEQLIAQIRSAANMPRWGRGIRLYAQSLAEKGNGLEGWRTLAAQLPPDTPESQLAADLLLDALLFAPNSESLLDQVWADLVAEQGQILRRLLQRLLHVASVPDQRFQDIPDRSLAESAEAMLRIPHPLYWCPALRVFRKHAVEIARLLPIDVAEVCALWLRTMPLGMIGRSDAAAIAVEVAKEIQGRIIGKPRPGKHLKIVFEALLYAAADEPGVGQIALQLAGRLPEPSYAIHRSMDLEEERQRRLEEVVRNNPSWNTERRVLLPGTSSYRITHVIPPEPDGPSREIPAAFRSAVLDGRAMQPLMLSAPDAAREILLAVCIQEPDESASESKLRDLMGPRLGLSDWPEGRPSLPWKGGFLRFLELTPEAGLSTIIDLVNYATAKWLLSEASLRSQRRQSLIKPQTVEFDGREVAWIGNASVFGWNRLQAVKGPQIECALMALEQWLDEKLSRGRPIDPWVKICFGRGESVAFAGVLVAIGIKHPELFTNVLQPLLGNYFLYRWQESIARSESGRSWLLSVVNQPTMLVQNAVQWHEQPSRICLLRDVAIRLMLQYPATAEYIASRKTVWMRDVKLSGEAKINFEFFLARFDPANYTEQPTGDGCDPPLLKWPEHLQKIADESLPVFTLRRWAMELAPSARRLLDGQAVLGEAQLPDFIQQLRRLAEWNDPQKQSSEDHYRASSIAGGLAVLIVLHADWLSVNPEEEEWVIETLRALEPVFPEFHSPHVPDNLSVESFKGEAAILLLARDDSEWIRRMAFEGITAITYSATSDSMVRAYGLRSVLGGIFTELVNVVLYWSALRNASARASTGPVSPTILAKQKSALLGRFIAGRLKQPVRLSRVERLGRYLVERIERIEPGWAQSEARRGYRQRWAAENREIDRQMPDLDLEVLRCGFSFLVLAISESPTLGDLDSQVLTELFDLEISTFPVGTAEIAAHTFEGTPWDFDRWILQLAAIHMARIGTGQSERFFGPLLRIAPSANYWGKAFLTAWVVDGLPMALETSVYIATWNAMVDYVWPLAAWQASRPEHYCPAEYVAHYLLGLHDDQLKVLGRARYQTVVSGISVALNAWAGRWLGFPSMAQWYALFLTTESGLVLLPEGLIHLSAFVDHYRPDDFKRYELGDLISQVLSLAWSNSRNVIEERAEVQQAFLKILTNLCARPVPQALQLRTKVESSLHPPS